MTRADRKNAVWRKTRLKFQQPFAAAGRPSACIYEALSKTRYNSVRISNFGLKFLQYIVNILYFRIEQQKKFRFFQPKLPDYYLNNMWPALYPAGTKDKKIPKVSLFVF